MLQPVEDMSHEMFWRQMLRWLVSDTPIASFHRHPFGVAR